nr:hypothetical protein [Leptospira interrogans]
MKHLIITCSDENYAEFLLLHWLESLFSNLKLEKFEIAILDYGLNEFQKKILLQKNVKIFQCQRNGYPCTIRFRDLEFYLEKSDYDQVLMCDSGDIIFQDSIANLFEENKESIRAICEDSKGLFDITYLKGVNNSDYVSKLLKGRKLINAGFLLGPSSLMKELCNKFQTFIKNDQLYGPDQIIINYLLYRDGFVQLDQKYNFIPISTKRFFKIEKGVFLDQQNDTIPVVHNAGGRSLYRPIQDFGFGAGYNRKLNKFLFLIRFFNNSIDMLRSISEAISLIQLKKER